MTGLRYVYWQDGEFWLGYLEEYPDYMTQGESLQDLQEHLRDLYADLSGGHIPAVRKVAELEVAEAPGPRTKNRGDGMRSHSTWRETRLVTESPHTHDAARAPASRD